MINKHIKNFIEYSDKFPRKRGQWLKEKLFSIPEGKRVIDVGAGQLRNKKYCSHLIYESQDFCEYTPGGNELGLQADVFDYSGIDIVSDITSIPVANCSYDVVMCTEVFEHIIDPVKAFYELNRILKPGGHIILTAPYASLTHMAPYHYYSGLNKYFYNSILTELHYQNIEITPNGDFFSFLNQEITRLPKIARDHANTNIGIISKCCIYVVHRLLLKLEQRNKGSEELINQGYFVFAQKKI